jgi:hypothetical protein
MIQHLDQQQWHQLRTHLGGWLAPSRLACWE